jgi:hypothetical protein
MIKTKKWVLLLSVLLLFLTLFIALRFWSAMKTVNKVWADAAYKARYIECDPNELFVELERRFQCKLPTQICGIRTARNYGLADSSRSCYIVKFFAEPNSIAVFLSSLPEKVDFIPYSKQKDTRYLQTKWWLPPSWFTEPINSGKIGVSYNDFEIVVDTSVEQRYIVYLWGSGDLPVPETNSHDRNEVSSQFNKRISK